MYAASHQVANTRLRQSHLPIDPLSIGIGCLCKSRGWIKGTLLEEGLLRQGSVSPELYVIQTSCGDSAFLVEENDDYASDWILRGVGNLTVPLQECPLGKLVVIRSVTCRDIAGGLC